MPPDQSRGEAYAPADAPRSTLPRHGEQRRILPAHADRSRTPRCSFAAHLGEPSQPPVPGLGGQERIAELRTTVELAVEIQKENQLELDFGTFYKEKKWKK